MISKFQLSSILVFSFISLGLISPTPALANCHNSGGRTIADFPTWDEYLPHSTDGQCRATIERFPQDLALVAVALVDMLVRLSAFVAVGFVIFAGFKFMLAQGQPDKLADAKKTISNAITGLIIAIIAVAIISFVANLFGS